MTDGKKNETLQEHRWKFVRVLKDGTLYKQTYFVLPIQSHVFCK